MIVLDTNVVSEGLRPSPATSVMAWLDAQDRRAIFTTTITQAEVLYGIEILPMGKRRTNLAANAERVFADLFSERILPFDEQAARIYARVMAGRASLGRPISEFDAMIAAIAHTHQATVATRNTADFEHCGVHLINPWNE